MFDTSLILEYTEAVGAFVHSAQDSSLCPALTDRIKSLPFSQDVTLETYWIRETVHEALWIDEEWPSSVHLQTWVNSCLSIMRNVRFLHVYIPIDNTTQLAAWKQEWSAWLGYLSRNYPRMALSWRFRAENIAVIAWLDQWAAIHSVPMQVLTAHRVNTSIHQRAATALGNTIAERFDCRLCNLTTYGDTRGAETCRHQIDGVTLIGFAGGFLALCVDGWAEMTRRDPTFKNRRMIMSVTSEATVAEQYRRTHERHIVCVHVEADLTMWSINAEGMVLKWPRGAESPIIVQQLSDLHDLTMWCTERALMVRSKTVLCVIPRDDHKLSRFFQKSSTSTVAREHDALYVEAGAVAVYVVGSDVFVKRP